MELMLSSSFLILVHIYEILLLKYKAHERNHSYIIMAETFCS